MKPGDIKKNLTIQRNKPAARGLDCGRHPNSTHPAGAACAQRFRRQCHALPACWYTPRRNNLFTSYHVSDPVPVPSLYIICGRLYYWSPVFTGSPVPTLQIKAAPSVRAPEWGWWAGDEHTVWVKTQPQSFRAHLSQQHNLACPDWQRILSNLKNLME